MNRKNPIAMLLTGAMLGAVTFAAHAQPAGSSMMPGKSPHMMMRNCNQNDTSCTERMQAHRQRMEQMHAIAGKLKAAKTDTQRVALLQSYVELMDEQMSQMADMMDRRQKMMGPGMGPPPVTPDKTP